MATNHFYDETAAHSVVVAAMAEAVPLLRSALLGAYIELVSMAQKKAVAAVQSGAAGKHVAGMVTRGDLVSIEPWATDILVDALVRYEYLEPVGDGWRLVAHKYLAHWESPETLAWRAQQRKDLKDPVLCALVRLRDGDQCRCCRTVVRWGAPSDAEDGGTYDHVDPRVLANGDPEKLAVTCRRCNGIRSNRPDANEIAPHQPAPEVPYYTASTAKYLRARGHAGLRPTGKKHLLPRIEIVARPASPADTAPQGKRPASSADPAPTSSDPAASGTTHTSEAAQDAPQGPVVPQPGQRPACPADTAPQGKRPASSADPAPTSSDPAASGTTRDAVRPQIARSSLADRQPTSTPEPPSPRSEQPPRSGGLTGGDGKGRGGSGSGDGGAARRSRRSRRSKPTPRS